MKILKAEKSDLKDILELQYTSYQSEALINNNFNIQPLTQTLDELEQEYENFIILKAIINNKIIGSVRAYEEKESCYIGKLIVHPDHQNNGLVSKLMKKIELLFNYCNRYELFTSGKSEKNLYLYGKLGYQPFKTIEMDNNLKLIYLEKRI